MSSQPFMVTSKNPFSYPVELQLPPPFQTMYLDRRTLHFLCIVLRFMYSNGWKICLVSESTMPLKMNIYFLKLSKFILTR